jgi:exonuclease III
MKILSFNCRGVVRLSNFFPLKWLIKINQPDIIFLQETMGAGIELTDILEKLLKNWNFSSMEGCTHSGILAMGWNPKLIKVVNIWGFDLCMGA